MMHKALGSVLVAMGLATASLNPLAQETSYLDRSNTLIAEKNYAAAEAVLRKGLSEQPNNLVYRNQLALCLIKQGRLADAEVELDTILKQEPENVAALWYRSIAAYESKRYREAVRRFERTLPLLDRNSPQYWVGHWMIGSSFEHLLKSSKLDLSEAVGKKGVTEVGLTQQETDRMVASFKEYLRHQPDAPDRKRVEEFLQYVDDRRPPSNVKRWIIATSVEE